MLKDIAGSQQEQARPQRLTASQAAAQSADACQQPAALVSARRGTGPAPSPLAPPSSASPAAGLTAPSGGGGASPPARDGTDKARPGLEPAQGLQELGISGLAVAGSGLGPVSPDLLFSLPSQR